MAILPDGPLTSAQLAALAGPTLVADSQAAAAANTAAIQAVLDLRGTVQILTGGTYYINPGLIIYSKTKLVLGESVILKQADGVEGILIHNANWKTPKVAVTNGCTDAAVSPAFTGRRLVTADCGANAHGLVAGDTAWLRGDTTRRYNGMFEVVSATAFTFTFYASKKSAIGSSSGTMYVDKADSNIEISGGTWDFNGRNNQSSYDMPSMLSVFSKVRNLRIHDTVMFDATKYCIYAINTQDAVFKNIEMNSASDGIHLHAFCYNPKATNLSGECGDDFIAWTANNTGYTQYDFLNTDGSDSMSVGGDCLQPTFKAIYPRRGGECVIAFYPIGTNALEGVLCDGFGTGQDSANCIFSIATGGAGAAGSAVKDVTLRNARGIGRSSTINVGRSADTNGVTIEKLDLTGFYPGATYTNAQGLIAIFKSTVTKLFVAPRTKITYDITSAIYFIQHDSTSTLPDITVEDYECATTGSGSFHSVLAGDGALTLVKFVRPRLFGTSQTMAGSYTGTPTIQITDWYVNSSRLCWVDRACRLEVKNGRAAGSGGTPLLCVFGTAAADVVSHGNDWGTSTYWLQIGTVGGDTPTCNLYIAGQASAPGYGTGIQWTATAPTVRLRNSDGGYQIDAAKFTSIDTGCVYYNNNAAYMSGAGIYTKGPSTAARIDVDDTPITGSNTLLIGQTGLTFTNDGASALVTDTLPAATVGVEYSFACLDTDGIRVVCVGSDVIRLAGSVSAAAGRIDSVDIGSCVRLKCVKAGIWTGFEIVGTWSVT